MGKSVSNTGFDFNSAFDQATGTKKQPISKQSSVKQNAPGGDFNSIFDASLKKKVGGSESSVSSVDTGLPSTPPSPSPENINNSYQAFQNKKATTKDIDVLATTDFGKQNGFDQMTDKAKSVFVAAHNGEKVSDLHDEAFNIINNQYPKTGDPTKDKIRDKILQGFQSSNSEELIKVQKNIDDSYQQQINALDEQQRQRRTDISGMRVDPRLAQQQKSILDTNKQKLLDEQRKAKETLQAYGAYTMVKSGAFQNFMDSELSSPAIKKSVAAISLGKQLRKSFGLPQTTNNTEYDEAKAGLGQMLTSLNMEANDLFSQGLKTKNADLIKQAQDRIEKIQRYAHIYNTLDTEQYPDVGRQHTARFLSDVLSEMGQNKVYTSQDDVYKAAQYAKEKYGFDLNKYGPLVDIVAKSEGSGLTSFKSGDIAAPGFRGALEKGTLGAIYNFGDVADWFLPQKYSHKAEREESKATDAIFKGTAQSGGYPTRIVYDSDGKAFREVKNENYGKVDWNNAYRFLGESLPSLAEFVALDKGIGGAAKGATEFGLKGVNAFGKGVTEVTNALTGVKNVERGYEAIKLGQKFEQTAGLLGSTYFTSYDENHKLADEWIKGKTSEDEAKKNALAHLLTFTQFAAFKAVDYSPSRMVEKLLAKQAAPEALEVLEKANWQKLTGEQQAEFFKDKILPRVKAFAEKGAENLKAGAKVGAASVIDQRTKDIIGAMVDPDTKGSDLAENAKTLVEQALLMTVVGLPGMVKSGAFPRTAKDALYEAGLYAPQYIDRINDRLSKGLLDEAKANEMIAMVKTMGEEIHKAGYDLNDKGLPTITRQKKDIAIANFRRRAADMLQEKGVEVSPEKVANETKEDIKTVKAENFTQDVQESPTFKSVLEVETGKKPATIEDIKPEGKYTYDKEGKTVTESGADLINHLENGDIYHEKDKTESPESKNTESEISQTPEGEGKTAEVVRTAPIIARHGETDANVAGEPQSETEPLNDKGKEQAAALGDQFAEKGVKTIVSSPMERSKETAQIAADKSGASVKYNVDLREWNNGGPESFDQFADRIAKVRDDLAKLPADNAVITHGNVLKMLDALDRTNGDVEAAKKEFANSKEYGNTEIYSPQKPITDGNQKEGRGSQEGQENAPQKGGQEVQKDAEGNVLTLQSEAGAATTTETAPAPEHTVKFNEQSGMHEVITPDGNVVATFKDEAKANQIKDEYNEAVKSEAGAENKSSNQSTTAEKPTAETIGENKPPTGEGGAETAASKNQPTGIRDSIVNEERVNRGLKPLVKEFTRSWSENWNNLKEAISNGFNPRSFIESVATRMAKKERVAFTDADYATLLFDRLNIQNNLANARDAIEAARVSGDEGAETAATDLFKLYDQQLEQNDIVGRQLKSETGRALSAVQMMANMDGELVSWTKNLENLYRGEMPGKIKEFVERIEKEYKEKNQQLKDFYESELKRVAEEAFKKAQKESKNAPRGNINEINNILENEYKTTLFEMQQATDPGERAKILSTMSQRLYESMANSSAFIGRGEEKSKLQTAIQRAFEKGEYSKESLRNMSESEIADASRRLLETIRGEMALQRLSFETPQRTKGQSKSIKLKGKDLADKIRKLRPGTGAAQANIFGLAVAVYDTTLVAIANAVEAGASLADAINEAIKDIKFNSDKDRNDFVAHLQNVEEPTSPQAVRANLIEDIKSIAKENNATGLVKDAVKTLKVLMKNYVQDGGVKSLDELVKKTYDDLKSDLPDIDEKEIRDAFSGYGMKGDTETKMKSDLVRMKGEAREISEYQQLLQRPAGETPAQEFKRLSKAAEKYKKVKDYMRIMGIDEQPVPTTEEGRKAVALEASKKRMKSIIEDLSKQILAGERKERNGVTPDAELTQLKAERERLSKTLDEIERSRETPEEKIKKTEDALNRQIFNYEKQLRESTNPLRPKEGRPSTKQIEQLRRRKNQLKKQLDQMRAEMNPNIDPAQKALDKYNEGLQKKIFELEDKIENKDFEPEEKTKPVDFTKNEKSLELETRLKKLQNDYYGVRKAAELANKSWTKKAMSLASSLKRAFVLSRIATFVRLGAAVAWNSVFKPVETISGLGLYGAGKLGFARKLSGQADRYGITSLNDVKANLRGEWDAIKTLWNPQTFKDFVNDWKNGYSELSLMYDPKSHPDVPRELRDGWQNIEHGLETFARGHGAVKGIAKRMEFNRSYAIRKEAARRKGQDVANPVVQYSIGAMAYQDAMRSILMEGNRLSDKYQKGINELQNGGFGANVLALTLQEMMPIVKIPTNLILNAGRATLGTPLAGGVIAVRGLIELMSKGESKYGISKLTAEQSDALLRNLRMGNVGMALILGGFFAPNLFGASHFYQKGVSQPDDMEEGDVKFLGVNIPRWLADNPYLVSMKIGASLRSVFDYYHNEKDKNFAESAVTALLHTGEGVIKETPILGTPSEAIKWLQGNSGQWFWYSQVKSTLEPGILQEAAESTDNANGWYRIISDKLISGGGERIKRKPESTLEALKTGIPGLRQQVEEK